MPSDLDAAIRERLDVGVIGTGGSTSLRDLPASSLYTRTIRAVLNVHQAAVFGRSRVHLKCMECSRLHLNAVDWPCKTVRAIATGLRIGEIPPTEEVEHDVG